MAKQLFFWKKKKATLEAKTGLNIQKESEVED